MTTDTTTRSEPTTRAVRDRRAWSPAQILAGAVGLFLIVMGGVAMARAGIGSGLTTETVTVFGFGHTALWGLVEVVIGLLFAGAAVGPSNAKRSLGSLGALALAFGLIVLIEPAPFSDSLGISSATGALFTGIGAASLVMGWWAPTFVSDETRSRETG